MASFASTKSRMVQSFLLVAAVFCFLSCAFADDWEEWNKNKKTIYTNDTFRKEETNENMGKEIGQRATEMQGDILYSKKCGEVVLVLTANDWKLKNTCGTCGWSQAWNMSSSSECTDSLLTTSYVMVSPANFRSESKYFKDVSELFRSEFYKNDEKVRKRLHEIAPFFSDIEKLLVANEENKTQQEIAPSSTELNEIKKKLAANEKNKTQQWWLLVGLAAFSFLSSICIIVLFVLVLNDDDEVSIGEQTVSDNGGDQKNDDGNGDQKNDGGNSDQKIDGGNGDQKNDSGNGDQKNDSGNGDQKNDSGDGDQKNENGGGPPAVLPPSEL